MSMNDNGKGTCDRCGGTVGNGAVTECIVVGDLDPNNEGHVRNLHFCRANDCAGKVLSAANMAHYNEKLEKATRKRTPKKTTKKKASA